MEKVQSAPPTFVIPTDAKRGRNLFLLRASLRIALATESQLIRQLQTGIRRNAVTTEWCVQAPAAAPLAVSPMMDFRCAPRVSRLASLRFTKRKGCIHPCVAPHGKQHLRLLSNRCPLDVEDQIHFNLFVQRLFQMHHAARHRQLMDCSAHVAPVGKPQQH